MKKLNDYINNPDISVEVNNVLFGYCCLSLEENMLCVCLVFFTKFITLFKKTPKDFILYIVLYNNVLVCNPNLHVHVII